MAQWYFGDASSKFRPYVGPVLTTPPSLIMDLTIMAKSRAFRSQSERFLGSCRAGGGYYLINRDWLVNMSVWYMDIDPPPIIS